MKLLYVSIGHAIQCPDDCIVWSDLGIKWYDTGYYSQSNGCGDLPKIKNYYATTKYRKFLQKCGKSELYVDFIKDRFKTYAGKSIPNVWKFTKEFINGFDVVLFNHDISNVINNLDVLKDKIVIFKSFGMGNPADEPKIGTLRALKKIIRVTNSLHEDRQTPLYGGNDFIIHSSVVPDDNAYNNWQGNKSQVCIFCNGFMTCPDRRKYYKEILGKCSQIRFLLYGANNEKDPLSCGFCSTNEKIQVMKDSRVSLIVGTPGSSYTFSLAESMIMGCPTVCFGKSLWNSKIYEIDELFNHGEDILIGETTEECSDYIQLLLKDKKLCDYLSQNARKKALKIFGREAVANEWRKLFIEVCGKDFNK